LVFGVLYFVFGKFMAHAQKQHIWFAGLPVCPFAG
jgi:hypothetical protein